MIARYPRQARSASSSGRERKFWPLLIWLLSFSGCTQAQDAKLSEAVRLIRQADSAFAEKDYQVAADKAAQAGKLAQDTPFVLQRAAEILYLSGHAPDSLPLFDRVVELVPEQAPENWQRGIALCTCGNFEAGAEQFKEHHDVNPDDVENSAWYFLCIAKTKGLAAARETVIPSRGDGREPMMSILQMLQGKMEPAQVIAAAEADTLTGDARKRAQFYAALYVGLYFDSLGDKEQAVVYLKKSLSSGDEGYMVDTAKVYLADRFGRSSDKAPEPAK